MRSVSRISVPCRFTVGISTEPDNMTNAAERLLGLTIENIQNIATDILFGQLRLVIDDGYRGNQL